MMRNQHLKLGDRRIVSERFVPSPNHWAMRRGLFRERVTKAQLRDLLLNQCDPTVRGTLCKWKHKHLGVGVYELWVEEPKEQL